MAPDRQVSQEEREAPMRNHFLNHHLLVHLSDKRRALLGLLVCADTHGNIILQETTEYLLEASGQLIASRFVPLLMIPGKHIESVAKPTEFDGFTSDTWDPYI